MREWLNFFQGADSGGRFEDPLWLLLLPLGLLLLFFSGRKGGSSAIMFSSSVRFLKDLGKPPRSRMGGLSNWLLAGSFVLGVLALARPQLFRSEEKLNTSGVEITLAIDVSQSMAIEDFKIGGQRVNRLMAAKKVTREFVKGRPNDRIGVVAFAGKPYVPSPLTLDHEWVMKSIQKLEMGIVEGGTAIGSAIAAAASRLEKRESKSRVIVLLTDGSNNSGELAPLDAANLAKTLGLKIYTIAIGTPGMHEIPFRDQFGRVVNTVIQSEFDEETLKEIAVVGDGVFFHAKDTKGLVEVFDKIDSLEKTEMERSTIIHKKDFFPWMIGGSLALLLVSAILQLMRRTTL